MALSVISALQPGIKTRRTLASVTVAGDEWHSRAWPRPHRLNPPTALRLSDPGTGHATDAGSVTPAPSFLTTTQASYASVLRTNSCLKCATIPARPRFVRTAQIPAATNDTTAALRKPLCRAAPGPLLSRWWGGEGGGATHLPRSLSRPRGCRAQFRCDQSPIRSCPANGISASKVRYAFVF